MFAKKARTAERTRKPRAPAAVLSAVRRSIAEGPAPTRPDPSIRVSVRSSVRLDKGFGQTHRLRVGQRVVQLLETVGPSTNRPPRHRVMVPIEHPQGTNE